MKIFILLLSPLILIFSSCDVPQWPTYTISVIDGSVSGKFKLTIHQVPPYQDSKNPNYYFCGYGIYRSENGSYSDFTLIGVESQPVLAGLGPSTTSYQKYLPDGGSPVTDTDRWIFEGDCLPGITYTYHTRLLMCTYSGFPLTWGTATSSGNSYSEAATALCH